ncbi:hypothetical protein PVK73_25760 [Bacillus thuringiensis]
MPTIDAQTATPQNKVNVSQGRLQTWKHPNRFDDWGTLQQSLIPAPHSKTNEQQTNLENVEQIVQVNANLIWNTRKHTEQIWPENEKISEKFNRDVLMTDRKNYWIIKNNNQIEKGLFTELPKHVQDQIQTPYSPSFGEIEYDGKMINYVEITEEVISYKGPDTPYRVLMHEYFHMYYQRNWKAASGTGWESPLYTDFLSPRQSRLEIMTALQKALEHPNEKKQHLEAAAWWYQKYKTENPREYQDIQVRDQLEGTARYFETLGCAYGYLGIQAPKTEIYNWVLNDYKKGYQAYLSTYTAIPGKESYEIHSRASLLLDISQEHPNWKQEVAEATLPLDILLEKYTPSPQKPSPELKQLLKTSYNNKVKPGMKKLLGALHEKASIFLVTNAPVIIPTNLIGVFRANEFKNLSFFPYLDSYISSNKGNIHLKGGSYIWGTLDETFLNPAYDKIIPLPKNVIFDEENTTLQATSETIELNMKYDSKHIGKDGKTYYIVDINK